MNKIKIDFHLVLVLSSEEAYPIGLLLVNLGLLLSKLADHGQDVGLAARLGQQGTLW